MRVLIACETSGRTRRAFQARGHDVYSVDLLPADDGETCRHIVEDVRDFLRRNARYCDLMIAHPDCTFLCSSGLHWNKRRPERAQQTEEALEFVRYLLGQPIPRIALENPIGCISTRIRKPDQIIQPYDFGEDASKATCLWLKGLPLLKPTLRIPGRVVNGRERWGNQTDSGQNRLGPSDDRWKERAATYPGIAAAFAEQWG